MMHDSGRQEAEQQALRREWAEAPGCRPNVAFPRLHHEETRGSVTAMAMLQLTLLTPAARREMTGAGEGDEVRLCTLPSPVDCHDYGSV